MPVSRPQCRDVPARTDGDDRRRVGPAIVRRGVGVDRPVAPDRDVVGQKRAAHAGSRALPGRKESSGPRSFNPDDRVSSVAEDATWRPGGERGGNAAPASQIAQVHDVPGFCQLDRTERVVGRDVEIPVTVEDDFRRVEQVEARARRMSAPGRRRGDVPRSYSAEKIKPWRRCCRRPAPCRCRSFAAREHAPEYRGPGRRPRCRPHRG